MSAGWGYNGFVLTLKRGQPLCTQWAIRCVPMCEVLLNGPEVCMAHERHLDIYNTDLHTPTHTHTQRPTGQRVGQHYSHLSEAAGDCPRLLRENAGSRQKDGITACGPLLTAIVKSLSM